MKSNAIQNFIKKYKIAQQSKSKEIRISIDEATDLIAELAMLNVGDASDKKLNSIIDLLKNISNNGPSSGGMDGGTFK